jgi:hypothetical protein
MHSELADQGAKVNFFKIFRDKSDAEGSSDNRFFTAPDAFRIITEMDDNDIKNYCESTQLIITEEQFNFAKKFLAFIALTKGEEIAISLDDGAQIKNHLEVYLKQGILDESIPQKITNAQFTTLPIDQQIQSLADDITFDNIKKFYQRLLSKRPKLFTDVDDKTEIDHATNKEKKHHSKNSGKIIQTAFDLENFISYLEIEVGALMLVSSKAKFISTAKKDGQPWIKGDGVEYQEETQLNLLVGARLEIFDHAMEGFHVINRDDDKIQRLRAIPECRIKPVISSGDQAEEDKKKFWEIYDIIWEDIYQTSPDKTDDGEIKLDSLVERLTESYKLLILNAIAQEKKARKKAYLRISPIGDGAWANGKQNKIREACGIAVARIIKSLNQKQIESIGAIEFAQFRDNAVLHSFLQEARSSFPLQEARSTFPSQPSQDYQTIFPKIPQDQIDASQIHLAQIMLKSKEKNNQLGDTTQIPIVNFCHNGDVNRKIPFQQLQTSCSEKFSTTPTDNDLTAYIICPWDAGCRGIGNEYHTYRPDFFSSNSQDLINHRRGTLQLSMDPVMACASPISLLTTDPEINKQLANNLFVINQKGEKLSMEHFGLLKELKDLGYSESEGFIFQKDYIEFPDNFRNIFKFLGINQENSTLTNISDLAKSDLRNNFELTLENIAKLPKYSDIKSIAKNVDSADEDEKKLPKDEKKVITNLTENQKKTAINLNPILPKLPQLLKKLKSQIEDDVTKASSPNSTISQPLALQILDYQNIWQSTSRGNKLNSTNLYKTVLGHFSTQNTTIINPFAEFSASIFCKAYLEIKESISNDFSFQDALDALFIAKAFGGLSNVKNTDDEKYCSTNQDFLNQIKNKFPNDDRVQALTDDKLNIYKSFSAKFQELNGEYFKSGRTPNNQTGLRLTFFPDQAISKLFELSNEEKIRKTSEDFNKSIEAVKGINAGFLD